MNLLSLCGIPGVSVDYVGPDTEAFQNPVIAQSIHKRFSRPFTTRDALGGVLNLAASSVSGIFHEFVRNNDLSYDIAFVESTRCSFVFDLLKGKTPGICCSHNVEFDYIRANRPGWQRFAVPLFWHSERRTLRLADQMLVLHDKQLARYNELYGSDCCKSYVFHPVCSAAPHDIPPPWNSRGRKAIITGSLDVRYNEVSIIAFLEQVWRRVSSTGYELIIAGRNPTSKLREKAKEYTNVTLIANPATMHDIMSDAALMIVPDLYGDGMKTRVAEGMSYGLPIAATSKGMLGYEREESYSVIGDSLEVLGAKLESLLTNPLALESMSARSKEVWESNYSAEVFARRIRKVVETTLSGSLLQSKT
jgi:glycosyltransferase involved in cell wall biosynthesis